MKESLHPLVVMVGNSKKMFFVPGLLEDPEVLSLRLICDSLLGDFSVRSPAAEVAFILELVLLSMGFVVVLLGISVEGPVKTSVSYNYIHLNLLKGKRQIFHFQ